ncbi:acyltransferase family protein [Luteibacter sp. NPDC031894]|uniref:acyltransferase family protein n=1 Tax=Luteibacter sp. NPDC031894 TaxID=3390572 RepID=UPI003D03754E
MKTLGMLAETRRSDEDNNFLLLRLLGALLVVYGHSFSLSGHDQAPDFLASLDPMFHTSRLGLFIFFTISGFLVSGSFDRASSVWAFLRNRALRIFPGLMVCALICGAVIGALYSTMPLGEYLRDHHTWQWIRRTALASYGAPDLTGVTFRNTSLPKAVNGSLWTIPVEVRLYLLAGFVGLIAFRRTLVATLVIAALVVAAWLGALPMFVAGGWFLILSGMFGLGALMYHNRNSIPLSWGGVALLALIAWQSHGMAPFYYLVAIATAYGVLVAAYSRPVRLPRWVEDYSYGTYLYAFPIQQMLSDAFPNLGPHGLAALAIPLALVAGAVSWRFVERPFLRLKARAPRTTSEVVAAPAMPTQAIEAAPRQAVTEPTA